MPFLLLFSFFAFSGVLQFDFGNDKAGSDWVVVNDTVMGGVSRSQLEMTDESLSFTGDLSLENNGGFVSMRSPYSQYDLSDAKEISFRVRGEGGTFALMLERHQAWYLPSYRTYFEPTSEWQTFKVKLKDIDEWTIQGKTGKKLNKEIAAKLIRMGFIKLDKKPGPFSLEVDYIQIN